MARLPNPDFYLERVAESCGPQRVRLQALAAIRHPSFAFLRRLLRGDNPIKIKAAAARRYQEKMTERKADGAHN